MVGGGINVDNIIFFEIMIEINIFIIWFLVLNLLINLIELESS